MRTIIACLVAAASIAPLTACVTNKDGGDDNDDDYNDNMSALIVPVEGQWHYLDVTQISSNCSAGDDGTAGSFGITGASASGFTVIDGETDPFPCSLSGNTFNCPNRASSIEDLRPDVDAVITAHATAQGTFSSATRGSGTQEASVTCTGTACSAAGTWPCQFKVSFQIGAY
jgi:hypothetical protein